MRRRRPRVVWLPSSVRNRLNPQDPVTGNTVPLNPAAFRLKLDVPTVAIPSGITGIIGVVGDEPSNAGFSGLITSLSDVNNSGYRLRRIVGKISCSAEQVSDNQGWTKAVVTCGFIILRVGPDGLPLLPSTAFDSYSTQSLDNVRDPWIWRRTWFVGNNAALLAGAGTGAFWPETNITQGSAVDGPHIDQKTARIISAEERLFFVASGVGIDGNNVISDPNTVDIIGEVRVLASMRTSSGNRRNASR